MKRLLGSTLIALGALVLSAQVQAAPTVAGTTIQNTAQVSYVVGTATLSTNSNTTYVVVAEILDVTVTLNSASAVPVTPGATQQALIFTVTNTGNGNEAFGLVASSTVTGDQFDPTPSTPFIYIDTDNSGTFSGSDVAYVPNTNDPLLAPGASQRIIVLNDIATSVVDNDRGRSQLTATARTGTGNAGTVFTNAGDGGTIDAIVGTTGASATTFGEYLVQALQLSAVKTQTIVDPFGGSRAVPGARINYQIVVTATGSGNATAVNFTDQIPANTTYVPGSLTLNSNALSDTSGNDAGEYATTPTPRVLVSLGNLSASSGTQTITFAVVID